MATLMLRSVLNVVMNISEIFMYELQKEYIHISQVDPVNNHALKRGHSLCCPIGRQCDDPKCRGKLKDTIINFGENLPEGKLPPIKYRL